MSFMKGYGWVDGCFMNPLRAIIVPQQQARQHGQFNINGNTEMKEKDQTTIKYKQAT